jgi:tRNA(fMet)-specific endonuclease VapC
VFVLDTNHLRDLSLRTPAGDRLQQRLAQPDVNVATTVVCAEEIQRGWLARISQARKPAEEILAYTQLAESISFLATLALLPWDAEAASRFLAFRQSGIRIGSMDLKIACIVLEHDATLLTRNSSDFAKVPGLRLENWLD